MARIDSTRGCSSAAPGLTTRRVAAELLEGVLHRGRPLDEQLDGRHALPGLAQLAERDRALARRIVATVLRRLGTLRRLIGDLLSRGLPAEAPRVETALLIGAAQILFLDVPDHAAVDLSVRLVQADRRDDRYAGLVNAVLRRIARGEGAAALAKLEPLDLDTPEWLLARWVKAYGADTAHAIARANRAGAAARPHGQGRPGALGGASSAASSCPPARCGSRPWTDRRPARLWRGRLVGAGCRRRAAGAAVRRPLRPHRGRSVRGARRQDRAARARRARRSPRSTAPSPGSAGCARTSTGSAFAATTVVAAAEDWQAGPFDAVLVDAPCTSTGTIRRHPDIPWRKASSDIDALVGAAAAASPQRDHADAAGRHHRVLHLLAGAGRRRGHRRRRARSRTGGSREIPLRQRNSRASKASSPRTGDLRTLPCHWPAADPRMCGLDGFYAARLERL